MMVVTMVETMVDMMVVMMELLTVAMMDNLLVG